MSTAARIRQLINGTAQGKLFSSRKCLSFGSRGAVDQAFYSLVKEGEIIRVARGIFMKKGSPHPTFFAVAQVKAEAFGKRIFQHGTDAAHALGFKVQPNQNPTFASSGRSSSFRCGNVVIRFVAISPRKLIGGDSLAGQVVRALWQLGKKHLSQGLVAESYPLWSKASKQLESAAPMLPAWMNNLFYWGRTGSRQSSQSGPLPPLFPDLSKLFPEFAGFYKSLDQPT